MAQTAAPSITQVHFEVHVLDSDRWTIDYVSTSEEDALEEAEELVRRPEISGVRVVKEMFNPRTEVTAARILFEQVRPPRPAAVTPLRMARPRPPANAHAPARPSLDPPGPLPEEEEPFSWLSLAGLSVLGAVGGGVLAVLLALLAGS